MVEAMETGVLAGFPMEDVKVELIDGSFHEVDSSEMAFKIAGSMAFREAAKKAHPVLLEPIEDVEVVVPEEYMGDVMGDLNSRRGHIVGMEPRAGAQVIRATVPLAQMFGYATDVRSMTQGRATYTMQFSHYAEVPGTIAQEIIAQQGGRSKRLTKGNRLPGCGGRLSDSGRKGGSNGEEEVCTDQASRQRGHHRSRRPRQDHPDRGHHQVPARI